MRFSIFSYNRIFAIWIWYNTRERGTGQMNKEKSNIIVAAIVGAAVLLLAALLFLPRVRYTTVKGKGEVVYIVDNFTGKTKGIRGSTMFDVETPKPRQEKPKPQSRSLNLLEIRNITGQMGPSSYTRGTFCGNLYNGNRTIAVTSIWIIVRITSNGNQEERKYVINKNIQPFATEFCSVDILAGGKDAKYAWWIDSAMGYDIDKAD